MGLPGIGALKHHAAGAPGCCAICAIAPTGPSRPRASELPQKLRRNMGPIILSSRLHIANHRDPGRRVCATARPEGGWANEIQAGRLRPHADRGLHR